MHSFSRRTNEIAEATKQEAIWSRAYTSHVQTWLPTRFLPQWQAHRSATLDHSLPLQIYIKMLLPDDCRQAPRPSAERCQLQRRSFAELRFAFVQGTITSICIDLSAIMAGFAWSLLFGSVLLVVPDGACLVLSCLPFLSSRQFPFQRRVEIKFLRWRSLIYSTMRL